MNREEKKITEDGYNKLVKKLEELKEKEMEMANRLTYEKNDGDLSENSAYTELKIKKDIVRVEINQISDFLEGCEIIEVIKNKIQIGSKVVYNIIEGNNFFQNKTNFEIEIASSMDFDPMIGKVSDKSVLGSSLIGKKVNDEVWINNISIRYKIKIKEIK